MTPAASAALATRPPTAGRHGADPPRADRHPIPGLRRGRHRARTTLSHRLRDAARRRRERRVRARCVRLSWHDHLAYWRARYLP